ncbi:MAG: hypothetical protein R3E08_05450 [Thiotrichaceae bacterium]
MKKIGWIDAACVGESGENVNIQGVTPLLLKAMGGKYRHVQQTDAFGFKRLNSKGKPVKPKKHKRIHVGLAREIWLRLLF